MGFWNLVAPFFIKTWARGERSHRVIWETSVWCGEEKDDFGFRAGMWTGHTSWCQTKPKELPKAGTEDGFGTGQHPNSSCEKQPQPQGLQRAPTATSSELRWLQEAEETQTQGLFQPWISATGLSHAELIDQLLLPCLPQQPAEVTLSHSFLILEVVILSQEPAWSRNIYSSQSDMKWFQLHLG